MNTGYIDCVCLFCVYMYIGLNLISENTCTFIIPSTRSVYVRDTVVDVLVS